MKLFFILILSLTLFSCSTFWAVREPDSMLDQKLDKWRNIDVSRLYLVMGEPYKIVNLPDGEMLVTYYKEIDSGDSRKWHCKIGFTINSKNRISGTALIDRKENVWGSYMPCIRIIKSPYPNN